MDAKDVLVSDIRVTALAPEGPYNFDWVDDNTITLTDDCQFDSVPSKVANAIRQKNIQIVKEDLESHNNSTVDSDSNNSVIDNSSNLLADDNESDNLTTVSSAEFEVGNSEKDKYVSFVVRMGDPSERQKVIEDLEKFNIEAAKKLQLSGPYKVVYKVTNNSLELVGMEDMGIGSEQGYTDV